MLRNGSSGLLVHQLRQRVSCGVRSEPDNGAMTITPRSSRRRLSVQRWKNCYPGGDSVMHGMSIGVLMSEELFNGDYIAFLFIHQHTLPAQAPSATPIHHKHLAFNASCTDRAVFALGQRGLDMAAVGGRRGQHYLRTPAQHTASQICVCECMCLFVCIVRCSSTCNFTYF